MRTSRDLRPEQISTIKGIIKNPQKVILAPPGSGKTPVVLYALAQLKKQHPRFKALVLAPIEIRDNVWEQEAQLWKGTRNLTFINMKGSPGVRQKKLFKEADIYLMNYELIPWLIGYLKALRPRARLSNFFDCVVFDELSFMKSPGAQRFKKLRSQITQVPMRIGMTGSPIGNSYLNLWSEMFCCVGPDALGSRFTDFQNEYFTLNYWKAVEGLKPGADTQIQRRIKPYCLYLPPAADSAGRGFNPIKTTLPKKSQALYDQLKEDLYAMVPDPTAPGLMDEVTGPAAVIANKLRQIESGAMWMDDHSRWTELHTEKIERTKHLIQDLQGEPLIIFYEFQHELERLKALGVEDIRVKGNINRWNNNEIPVLAAHPKSAGHGINLHLGGAHNLLFFTLPWSVELWTQAIGRLLRTGQQNTVSISHFAGMEYEDRLIARLLAGEKIEFSILKSIKSA